MLSKCANPACSAHFLYLHEGRVFRIMRDALLAHYAKDEPAKPIVLRPRGKSGKG